MTFLVLTVIVSVLLGIGAGYLLSLIGPLGFLAIALFYFAGRFGIKLWTKTQRVGSGVAGGLAAYGLGVIYLMLQYALISFSIALATSFTLSLAFLR